MGGILRGGGSQGGLHMASLRSMMLVGVSAGSRAGGARQRPAACMGPVSLAYSSIFFFPSS